LVSNSASCVPWPPEIISSPITANKVKKSIYKGMCSKLSLPKPVQNKNRYKSQPVLRKQWKKASRESDGVTLNKDIK
jgi:hypothetical protein